MKDINEAIEKADRNIIRMSDRVFSPFSRLALFVIFFWFGALKVFSFSPANPLVEELLHSILPAMSFDTFIVAFGVFEMIIGILFIVPHLERLAVALLVPHMVMTAMPLVLLPAVAWQAPLVPTLEGQYIIKNLAIVGLALAILSHLRPFHFEAHVAHLRAKKAAR